MTGRTLRRPAHLAKAGLVAPERLPALEAVAARYAVSISPAMADLIDAADPGDPIARQFVPDAAELHHLPEERDDPIGDHPHSPVPGLVHRYPDRVLLKLVHVCPVYCRFCFRREMVGPSQPTMLSDETLDEALAYVAARPEIWEVVITGGDPLILSPRRIAELGERLATIEHVKVVRWHSRVPVVTPDRVDAAMASALRIAGKAIYVVVHSNHPRELTPPACAALATLADAGIPLLSQSVLLRGVNDDPAVLGLLMRRFVENRVKPYYLHHGDLAPGTSHFRTTIDEGQAVMRALRGRFSGLCQPTYVLDIPGGHGKVPVGPNYVSTEDGACTVEDIHGVAHPYPPRSEAQDGGSGSR
ncbi:L-lysine 2,3-aminomutase [Faunimonas pinastri]|uniref:L-lysine 2,3-aminomutase n=1 Tax=Faunimonas pinastri TaxID=1855383 RepID=A0A1H9NHS0_9HYPH|nr:lysine-2,3-aminomutase-like protein [Faunimonas pinastri]SER34933.1 L-lysine 2,3-aminomutase [Faunimonas pinastri]